MHFVPAHWGAARALVLLHRHSHALLTARNGLEQLPLVKLPPNFTWPGTSKIMSEALLQNIEVRNGPVLMPTLLNSVYIH